MRQIGTSLLFQMCIRDSDVIIYKDTMFYSALPSAVKLSNGEILVSDVYKRQGLKDNIKPEEMLDELEKSQRTGEFEVEKYVGTVSYTHLILLFYH